MLLFLYYESIVNCKLNQCLNYWLCDWKFYFKYFIQYIKKFLKDVSNLECMEGTNCVNYTKLIKNIEKYIKFILLKNDTKFYL